LQDPLPGFDPGLMIRIDVHEGAVKPDRVRRRDERADLIDLRNAERDRVAPACRAPRAFTQKALQVIAARHSRFDRSARQCGPFALL
jgi:hypothetical protein